MKTTPLMMACIFFSLTAMAQASVQITPTHYPVACGYTPPDILEQIAKEEAESADSAETPKRDGANSFGDRATGSKEIDTSEVAKGIPGSSRYDKKHGVGSTVQLVKFFLGRFGPLMVRRACTALTVGEVSLWVFQWLQDNYGADPSTWPEPLPKGKVPGWLGPNFKGATNVK